MKQLLMAVALLIPCLSGCGSGGDSTSNGNERGPWIYANSDPGSYTLKMARSVRGDAGTVTAEGVVLTGQMPKKMLSACSPYSRNSPVPLFKVRELPDELSCTDIVVAFNYADGEPLYLSAMLSRQELEKAAALKLHPLVFGKPDTGGRLDLLKRHYVISAKITVGEDPTGTLIDTHQRSLKTLPESFEVLPDFEGYNVSKGKSGTYTQLIDSNARDGVSFITCFTPSNPVYFCTYHLSLSKHLQAQLTFLDFRLHGGRDFMRQRIATFKKQVCPYLKCT